jgi:hypothetical protein
LRIRRLLVASAVLIPAALAAAPPARGETDALLARAIGNFFREAEVLRIDAVPDLYEGGYARITFYARRARMANSGLVVDEGWVQLRGATLHMGDLRRGSFTVMSTRSAMIHLRVSLRSLQQYFATVNPYNDIRLWSDGTFLFGSGTVPLFNRPTRVEMKGILLVVGTHELFFQVETLRVNGFPVPDPLLRPLERQFNPILSQQDWPMKFTFRSVRLSPEDLVVSSELPSTICTVCGGFGPPPSLNP